MFTVKGISSNLLLFVVIGYCCFLNCYCYLDLLAFVKFLFIELISENLKCSCVTQSDVSLYINLLTISVAINFHYYCHFSLLPRLL